MVEGFNLFTNETDLQHLTDTFITSVERIIYKIQGNGTGITERGYSIRRIRFTDLGLIEGQNISHPRNTEILNRERKVVIKPIQSDF